MSLPRILKQLVVLFEELLLRDDDVTGLALQPKRVGCLSWWPLQGFSATAGASSSEHRVRRWTPLKEKSTKISLARDKGPHGADGLPVLDLARIDARSSAGGHRADVRSGTQCLVDRLRSPHLQSFRSSAHPPRVHPQSRPRESNRSLVL
ncbi:hypothetical protein Cni_G16443 [Canna indica]|uniref:Uncharacterized protein n=1 Tax=Canna indica TaxID=4628 RepID=A0AAQ3QFN4_9LILI|nr:hypothetical protein Cni_G16443 [Canna indica]